MYKKLNMELVETNLFQEEYELSLDHLYYCLNDVT